MHRLIEPLETQPPALAEGESFAEGKLMEALETRTFPGSARLQRRAASWMTATKRSLRSAPSHEALSIRADAGSRDAIANRA